MAINDFSTLICMAATMSIAFVATEYVTSYTKNLCERFFKFTEYVRDSYKKCRDILMDEESFKQLHPVVIDGQSTNGKIEEAKRKSEQVTKKINDTESKKLSEMTDMCQTRSMSSLCLFVFMLNTTLLLLGSVESKVGYSILKYSSTLCILSMIYILFGWCLGEYEFHNSCLRFSSLKHATYSFIVLVLLMIGLCNIGWCTIDYISNFWWWLLLSCTIVSYLNFLVFILKVRWKATKFKNDIEKSASELMEECKEIEKETQELRTISKVSADLHANPFNTLN